MNDVTKRDLTRRTALLGTLTGIASLAACSDKTKSPSTNNDFSKLPGPERIRAEAQHLEPGAYQRTYAVDATGKNGAFRTFAQAYAAIAADRQKRTGVTAPAQATPWDWRRITVAPGEYHECIKGVPPFTAIVGLGKNPTDARVWWDGNDNTFESTGRSVYVRNIHLDHTSSDPNVHAMRDNGHAGDVGMSQQRRTVVFDSVRFSSLPSASLSKCTNDMAPATGTSLTFRNCVFDGPGQPQSINLITNMGSGTSPSTISFVGCTIVSNHAQHPDKNQLQLGTTSAAPFGAPDFAHGREDRVLWMDGHWDVGTVGGVQALIVLPYISDAKQTGAANPHPATRYVIVNPGSVAGMHTVKTDKILPPVNTIPRDLHLPSRCFSTTEQEFFGQKPQSKGISLTAGKAAGSVDVKAGDVFWVRVDLAGRTLFPVSASVDATVTGTMTAVVALDANGKPEADGNAQTTGTGKTKSAQVALKPHWFFPGQGAVWVGITVDHDTHMTAMRATTGQVLQGTGGQAGQVPPPKELTPVSSGTLVPYITLHSQLPDQMQ